MRVALAFCLLLLAGCDRSSPFDAARCGLALQHDAPLGAHYAIAQDSETVPPREARLARGATCTFLIAQQSEFQLRVGLKLPDEQRGIWRGRWLISEAELEEAAARLASQLGVQILRFDGILPSVVLRISSQRDIEQLNAHPNVDYIENVVIPASEFVERAREGAGHRQCGVPRASTARGVAPPTPCAA